MLNIASFCKFVCMHNNSTSKTLKQAAEQKKVLTGNSVGFDVKVTWLAISKMFSPMALENGISVSVGFVLLNIHETKGTAATKIAPLLGMEPRSLTRLLKSMEAQKLIFRKPDEKDGRSVRIHLTDLGISKKNQAISTVSKFDKLVKKKISQQELAIFFESLETIYNLAEKTKSLV